MLRAKGSWLFLWIFLWTALLFGGSAFLIPAHAKYDRMHKAIDELTKAQAAPFGSAQQTASLNSALTSLKAAFARGGEKNQAMALVEAALVDQQAHNSAKFNQDITQALAAANAVIVGTPGDTAATPAATGATAPAAPAVKLTEDQARAVVLIKGDNSEGTGFLIKTMEGPTVVTNQHVIANNPNIKITTTTGTPITIVATKGATDRDLALISVTDDGSLKYLEFATDISSIVQPGDEVITPGNSEGGEVMLNTDGKVLGIGPDRIEFDNPVYHGNSGGPVFHVKSGKVIGVVTEGIKVDTSDALDKASFASRNSAIKGSVRYFGLRIDNIATTELLDPRRFQNETAFLDQFNLRSRCLDSFLNYTASSSTPGDNGKKKKKKKDQTPNAPAATDSDPADTLYLSDAQIMQANNTYYTQANGADTSQQMDALRGLVIELKAIANSNMEAIQVPQNFYAYDELRAKDEIAYRKALIVELDNVSNDVSRLGALPRTNN